MDWISVEPEEDVVMPSDRPLTKIMYENFDLLRPGRLLDRVIAENVLRYQWSNKNNEFEEMAWIKGSDFLFHSNFKPSTDINCALNAIAWCVDIYKGLKLRVDLSITHKKHWKISSTIFVSKSPNEVCEYSGEDLPFQICRCLVMTYLEYGPKDHETFNWRP